MKGRIYQKCPNAVIRERTLPCDYKNVELDDIMSNQSADSLNAVPVVSLRQHDLLRYKFALLYGAEANDISDTGIGVLVSMCNAHSSP